MSEPLLTRAEAEALRDSYPMACTEAECWEIMRRPREGLGVKLAARRAELGLAEGDDLPLTRSELLDAFDLLRALAYLTGRPNFPDLWGAT